MSDPQAARPFTPAREQADSANEARTWAVLAHVLPMIVSLISLGFFAWLPPLLILMGNRHEPFASAHARESLNFRLTLMLLLCLLLGVLWSLHLDRWFPGEAGFYLVLLLMAVALPVMAVIWVIELVLTIRAVRQASAGKAYRYPLSLRFVRCPVPA